MTTCELVGRLVLAAREREDVELDADRIRVIGRATMREAGAECRGECDCEQHES